MVAGYYHDSTHPNPLHTYHCWNYDLSKGLYIDLTQDQFHKPFRCPPISIVRSDHPNYIFDKERTYILLESRTPPSQKASKIIALYQQE